ncbi:hypothetical protein PAMP_003602 [Pampus punctatissimus]
MCQTVAGLEIYERGLVWISRLCRHWSYSLCRRNTPGEVIRALQTTSKQKALWSAERERKGEEGRERGGMKGGRLSCFIARSQEDRTEHSFNQTVTSPPGAAQRLENRSLLSSLPRLRLCSHAPRLSSERSAGSDETVVLYPGGPKSESQCAVRPEPPKDTGGEVGGLAEKLIQLGSTSQQRHVGFQRSTPSSEKAPFSRSPSLHGVFDTGIRVSKRLMKIVPTSYSSRVFFEKRKEQPDRSPGSHRGRTELYGECRTEWMNAAETERLAPLPLAQTLPRRPVGRPQLP